MPKADFTFVTYRGLPDLDPDDRTAADELERRGYHVRHAIWNDTSVDWSSGGTTIIRSTWDYHLEHERFLQWANDVSRVSSLWNPPPVLRWNAHKSYLRDLAKRGAAVVPTAWLPKNSPFDLGSLLRERSWKKAVVKPAVGLATRGVMLIDDSPDGIVAAQAHANSLLREHDVMVQPYLDSVEQYGERALVFIGGEYSHAVRKTAFQILAPTGEAGETLVDASRDEIDAATRAMQLIKGPAIYGRVDLVRGPDGTPYIIELELVEPSLFLSFYPPAAARFADVLISLL